MVIIIDLFFYHVLTYRLCFQINRIAIDKNRPVPKSPSAPAQNLPAQTRPAPPPQGAGAFAAATPPSQEGAGASGDDEENGRYILCVRVNCEEKMYPACRASCYFRF